MPHELFDIIYRLQDFVSAPNVLVKVSVHRLGDAYAEGAKIDPAQLEKAIMAGLVVKYLWFFGHLLAQPDDGIDADLEPRMRAMQLVLAAGARLQRGLRT